jgi:hypothetical protein
MTTTTTTRAKDHPAPPYEELAAGSESSVLGRGMHERFTDIAARRLAMVAERIPVTVPDGGRFLVRPLLSSDRHSVASGLVPSHERLPRVLDEGAGAELRDVSDRRRRR